MRILTPLLLGLALAGCATDVPVPLAKLDPPSARLMANIPDLPPVKAGDNVYEQAAVCRADRAEVASKAKGLQGYIRTVLQKQKKP